jgi:hypothetical protein
MLVIYKQSSSSSKSVELVRMSVLFVIFNSPNKINTKYTHLLVESFISINKIL